MRVPTTNTQLSLYKQLDPQKQPVKAPSAKSADSKEEPSSKVTISLAARNLTQLQDTTPNMRVRAITLEDAKMDPAYAKKIAEQFAFNDCYELHGPMLDITQDPIRYSATGEIVTDADLAAFKAEGAKVTAGRIALYQSEKTKGTPDAQILEKLYRFVDKQSDDYLSKLNWARPSSG